MTMDYSAEIKIAIFQYVSERRRQIAAKSWQKYCAF